ncbi:MAG: hypothetical protein C4319_08985 [Acidimicrobiia bacterium]|mgnify:FL=1
MPLGFQVVQRCRRSRSLSFAMASNPALFTGKFRRNPRKLSDERNSALPVSGDLTFRNKKRTHVGLDQELNTVGSVLEGWLLHYFLVLAICVVIVFIAALPLGKILSYRSDASRMRTEAARLRLEAEVLRNKAKEARNPASIERLARENLGLARPGEIVFVPVEGPWPDPTKTRSSTPNSVSEAPTQKSQTTLAPTSNTSRRTQSAGSPDKTGPTPTPSPSRSPLRQSSPQPATKASSTKG